MAVQKYSLKIWGAKPELTRQGYYPLNQVYNFIDICREEGIGYREICSILKVEFHRIVFFEKKRGVNV